MLTVPTEDRISLTQIVRHPFFSSSMKMQYKKHIDQAFVDEIMEMSVTDSALHLMDALGDQFMDARIRKSVSGRSFVQTNPDDTRQSLVSSIQEDWKGKIRGALIKFVGKLRRREQRPVSVERLSREEVTITGLRPRWWKQRRASVAPSLLRGTQGVQEGGTALAA